MSAGDSARERRGPQRMLIMKRWSARTCALVANVSTRAAFPAFATRAHRRALVGGKAMRPSAARRPRTANGSRLIRLRDRRTDVGG